MLDARGVAIGTLATMGETTMEENLVNSATNCFHRAHEPLGRDLPAAAWLMSGTRVLRVHCLAMSVSENTLLSALFRVRLERQSPVT